MPHFHRKKLPHAMPNWVPCGESYYLTINTQTRGSNQIAHPEIATAIKKAVQHYKTLNKWNPFVFIVMPDHIHGILALNTRNYSLRSIFKPWKSFLAKTQKISWQDDFFDHRIRNNQELLEKAAYIRNNPYRAGLIGENESWPYLWEASDFE